MKVKNLEIKFILLSALIMLSSFRTEASDQVIDDQEIVNIENLYKATPTTRKTEVKEPDSLAPQTLNSVDEQKVDKKVEQQITDSKIENLTDLNKLSPFREISVIQKKYLPKTERFQLFGGAGMTTNSPWFLNLGVKLGLGYYFTESFGIEVTGLFLSNSEREVSKEIRENNGLQPEKFVNTKSYMGADFVWAPIYGKLSMLNKSIIPFDMYFSAGGGTSSTNSLEGSVPTLHVGVGQIFAINKAMAFRWDYSWTSFQATPVADSSTANANPSKNSYNDLILTAGFSFFFPEAKYR
ncbi:MAG: outer membrane beta-barrel domain-containing protein [Pseudobdellovibrio sp.]